MSELSSAQAEAELEVKPYEVVDISTDPLEAYERGKTDINFFAALLLPSVIVSALPAFYVAIFKMLVNRSPEQMGRILRFALGLPRGHAKTTFVKIIAAWLIAYDKCSFVAVLCSTQPLADQLIADISEMLGSPNAEAVYGRWNDQLTTDSATLKKAEYHGRSVIIVARGANSAIRGINVKHRRPDFILCDDAQTKENDDSPTDSAKFRKWLVAMFKIIAPRGDRLIVYVGNMYSDTCILYQLKNNSKWISLITGAILSNGEPLWPELHSIEELYDSYVHDAEMHEADIWFAEVMNDPVSSSTSLINGPIPVAPWLFEKEIPDGVYITIDPAGFRKHSDDNVIAVHYVFEGKGTIRELDAGIMDPEQLIMQALRLAVNHGASVIGIEDAAYQQTLLFWVKKYLSQWRLETIEVVPLKHKNRSKEGRIRLFVAEVMAGNYFIHPEALAAWTWEALQFKIGKPDNRDNILDATAYGLDMRNDYWHLITNRKASGAFEAGVAAIEHDNTPF